MDQIIGEIEFVDGIKRPVFQQPDDRQYVSGDHGEPVYGVWIIPEEWVLPDLVEER